MTYESVAGCAEAYPVARVCDLLGVSESGYYAWKKRPPSQREQANDSLKAQIRVIWQQFRLNFPPSSGVKSCPLQ